jgi:hypothetical protein
VDLAVGPSWRDASGAWRSLAEMSPDEPRVEILSETGAQAAVAIEYAQLKTRKGDPVPVAVREVITVRDEHVTVESSVTGEGLHGMRITWPMLVFDGLERTMVEMKNGSAFLRLRGGGVRFEIIEPRGVRLARGGTELKHRNGMVEPLFVEAPGNRAVYRISSIAGGAL